MTERCGECRYYRSAVEVLGYCQRYPIPARKGPGEWCGEFAAAVEAPAENNVVNMPVAKKATRGRKRKAR